MAMHTIIRNYAMLAIVYYCIVWLGNSVAILSNKLERELSRYYENGLSWFKKKVYQQNVTGEQL